MRRFTRLDDHPSMKTRRQITIPLLVLATQLIAAGASAAPPQVAGGVPQVVGLADVVGGHASDHVILRLAPGVVPIEVGGRWGLRVNGRVERDSLAALREVRATRVRSALRRPPADAARAARVGLDRFVIVELPFGSDAPAVAARLARVRGVEKAETAAIGGVSGDLPNDPRFPEQWNLRNTGQVAGGVPGTPGADVDALGAWAFGTGTESIVVGVLDSGINQHQDLFGRILPGWNVPQNSSNTADVCSSHGTGVSSLLGGRGDDGVGMAGMHWAVRFLPVVVVNPCSGSEAFVAEGIVFAVDAGADILNMSLAYSVGSDLFRSAILYAADAEVIMVAASGNNGASQLPFPARWPEVIAVGASNNQDLRWSNSGYGTNMSIVAPGQRVLRASGTATYSVSDGTSFAVPHVSGTIALMLSRNHYLTPGEVRSILEQTATDLSPPGYDLPTGFGRLDAADALAATPIPGDLDSDGVVLGPDLAILLGAWGPCPTSGGCAADIDRDGEVGGADLSILLGAWGG